MNLQLKIGFTLSWEGEKELEELIHFSEVEIESTHEPERKPEINAALHWGERRAKKPEKGEREEVESQLEEENIQRDSG